MTRKDYEMIARSFYVDRELLEDDQKKIADYLIKGLAEQLQAMNPRFDSVKFFKACGVI